VQRQCSLVKLAVRGQDAQSDGQSKRPESLGKSAGAKLTVMRLLLGKSKPAF
jgi:hypothetical protein